MIISNVRRVSRPPSPRGFTTLAKFTAEPIPGFAVYDCHLVRAADGTLFVYGPTSPNGSPNTALSPAVRAALIELANAHLKDDRRDDRRAA